MNNKKALLIIYCYSGIVFLVTDHLNPIIKHIITADDGEQYDIDELHEDLRWENGRFKDEVDQETFASAIRMGADLIIHYE